MIFQDVNVSGLGPFAAGKSLRLSDRCNRIEGTDGSGKTTIAAELMRNFRSTYTPGPIPLKEALTLCFIGEDYTSQGRRTASILAGLLRDASAPSALEILGSVSGHVNRLMQAKLASGMSKFGNPEHQHLPFVVAVSNDGRVEVHDAHGVDLADLCAAAGERFVLALAVNFAVRDALGFREPIVVDGALRLLDRVYQRSCYEAIVGRQEQRIVLDAEHVFIRVGATPDFILVAGEARRSEAWAQDRW